MAPDERGNWCSRIISSQLSVLLLLMKVVIESSELAESQNWSLNYLQRELEFSTVCSKKTFSRLQISMTRPALYCGQSRVENLLRPANWTAPSFFFFRQNFHQKFLPSPSHHALIGLSVRGFEKEKKQIAPVPPNGVTGAGNVDHRDNITDWGRRWFLSDSSHPIFYFGVGLQNLEPDTSIFLALITM